MTEEKNGNTYYVDNKHFHNLLKERRKKVIKHALASDNNREKFAYVYDYSWYLSKNEEADDEPISMFLNLKFYGKQVRISEPLGKIILDIATNLGYYHRFLNYDFRDEMIGDGIENCIQVIDNFDVQRKNPFAYFTQICFFAFVRRIKKEYQRDDIIRKMIDKSGHENEYFVTNPFDIGENFFNPDSLNFTS